MSAFIQSLQALNKGNADNTAIDFASLPPFLRVLLTTDGTVTKSLEAFFWEPIEVVCRAQSIVTAASGAPAIALATNEPLIQRQVQLVGRQTAAAYVTAESYIRHSLLQGEFVERLTSGTLGIGELLRDLGLETYREVIALGMEEGVGLWRVYRIYMQRQPFIEVREEFPLSLYR